MPWVNSCSAAGHVQLVVDADRFHKVLEDLGDRLVLVLLRDVDDVRNFGFTVHHCLDLRVRDRVLVGAHELEHLTDRNGLCVCACTWVCVWGGGGGMGRADQGRKGELLQLI